MAYGFQENYNGRPVIAAEKADGLMFIVTSDLQAKCLVINESI